MSPGHIDALAIGRGTYDVIEHVDPLPFGERKLFVFTHRPLVREGITALSLTPEEAVAQWASEGIEQVYVDWRPQARLALQESKTFPSGVVWLRYQRD